MFIYLYHDWFSFFCSLTVCKSCFDSSGLEHQILGSKPLILCGLGT